MNADTNGPTDYVTVEWGDDRCSVAVAISVARLRGQLAAQGLAVVPKAEADELADLRGRVERAIEALECLGAPIWMPAAARRALEALRNA